MKREPRLSEVLEGAPLPGEVVCCDKCGAVLDWLGEHDVDAYGDEIYKGDRLLCLRCQGKLTKPKSKFWRKLLP